MTSLSERYFRPKAFETDGRLYAWLGVVRFKRALMGLVQVPPESGTRPTYLLAGRSLEDVRAFERRSRRNEALHGSWLVVSLGFLAVGALERWMLVAGALVFAANFHCFLLQRHNRARLYRVLERGRGAASRKT